MAWTFHAARKDDIVDVIAEVKTLLDAVAANNREGTLPALTAKLALANRRDGDGIGVVFYDNQITSIPSHPEGRLSFQEYTVRLSGDDPTDLYKKIADKLNTLRAYEAFWAQVGLTDRKGGDTTLSLYWPEETAQS